MDVATKLHCIDLRSIFITGSTPLPRLSPFPAIKAYSSNSSLKPSKSNVISNPAIKVAQITCKLSALAVETPEAEIDTRGDIELLYTGNSSNAGASTVCWGVRLVNVCKTYNGVTVLENVSWEVGKGEKVGLIGVNGAGKTTQLRIIAGKEEPDSGTVIKGTTTMKIALLSQVFEVSMSRTVKEEFMSVFVEEMDIAEKLNELRKEIREGASGDSELTRRLADEFDRLQSRAQAVDLSMMDAKINKLMLELGFDLEDSDRLVASFGSGWQMRISLGKFLLQEPDLLLLDEPTYGHDLDTIAWLAGYLKKQDVSMVIISGDGAFLDQLCTKIVETDMGISRTFQGNYSDYVISKEIEQTRNIINRLVAGVNPGHLFAADQAEFGASLASKTTIEKEESVIAAAAAEAVALAKAAVKFAKDAATLAQGSHFVKSEIEPKFFQSGSSPFYYMDPELLGYECSSSDANIDGASERYLTQHYISELDYLEPTNEELEVLQLEPSENIAVRSKRQVERKARRARAAEKATTGVPIKLGSNSRKRRTSIQEVDYSDPLRYIRGTTSSSRLLTAAEELELSGGIQDLLKLEKLYDELHERCGGEPVFAQWAAAAGVDQQTLRKRLNYGIRCKDKMIKSNIRLVISIAKNYQGAGMNLQDLVQEGCRGLVRGTEKFDASKGFKFSTYAHWWIKQAIRKSLSDQSRTIRLPFHMVEATYRVKEAKKQLYSENGRQPDKEEVAEATGLSMKRLNAVLLTPKPPRSLDQKIGINQDLKPSDVIADPDAETSEDLLMKQFMREDLEKLLNSLSVREKQVIRWRFGMEDGRMKTLQEIGEMMTISRERVRQIESSAFRKLNKKKTTHLQQYIFP